MRGEPVVVRGENLQRVIVFERACFDEFRAQALPGRIILEKSLQVLRLGRVRDLLRLSGALREREGGQTAGNQSGRSNDQSSLGCLKC